MYVYLYTPKRNSTRTDIDCDTNNLKLGGEQRWSQYALDDFVC